MSNSWLNGTTIDNDSRSIVTSGCHEATRHIFITSRDGDVAIVMLGLFRLNTLWKARIKSKTPYQNNLNFQLHIKVLLKIKFAYGFNRVCDNVATRQPE